MTGRQVAPSSIKHAAEDCTGAWQEVSDADLARFGHTCLSYADRETARYYLPAFMCYCLRHWPQPGDTLMWVLFDLDQSNRSGLPKDRDDPAHKFALYSEEQKSAI